MMTDWNTLRLVLELKRSGSLSAAAKRLGVNHATVSRQLARAEGAMGRRLFERLPSGMVPTAAGAVIADHAERMEADVLRLDFELGAREDEMAGPLAITVPPLVADASFAADLAAYQRAHPGVELSVLGDNRVLDLHRREADVAIRISRAPDERLWGRKVMEQRAGLFATPAFLAAHAAGLAGQGALPIISFTAWAEAVPNSIRQTYPGAKAAVTCDDMVAALSLAQAGVGALRAPFVVGNGAAGLVPIKGGPVIPYMPIWVLTHPDLRARARIAGFMSYIADRFQTRKALFQQAVSVDNPVR